jgi:hypothetical protein
MLTIVAATAALVVVVIAAWLYVCWRRPEVAVIGIVGLAVFLPHVLAFTYAAGADAQVIRLLIPTKDLLAVILVSALIVRALRRGWSMRWLIVPVVGLGLAATVGLFQGLSRSSSSDTLLSVRNLTVAAIGLVTGLLLCGRERRTAAFGIAAIVAAGATYALIECFLPASYLRDVIGVGRYWVEVKQQPFLFGSDGTGLPGNFFTSSGARRLSGSFGDPLAAGYVIAGALVLVMLSRSFPYRKATGGLLFVALLLTFTRGGLLLAMSALAPALVGWFRGLASRAKALAVAVSLIAIVVLLTIGPFGKYLGTVLSGEDSSTRGHLLALFASGDHRYTLLGEGLGSAGAATGSGTENVLITIALQSGLVGVLAWSVGTAALIFRCWHRWRRQNLAASFLGLVCAIVATMVISEQFLTFSSGWMIGLVLAIAPWQSALGEFGNDGPHSTPRHRSPATGT